jgi:hypothetical protein
MDILPSHRFEPQMAVRTFPMTIIEQMMFLDAPNGPLLMRHNAAHPHFCKIDEKCEGSL